MVYSNGLDRIMYYPGLKAKEFPKEIAAQNMQANIMIKDLISRILGREEPYSISVRKGSGTQRYVRDSPLLLLTPVEVVLILLLILRLAKYSYLTDF
jgi:hypothetical protein